MRTLVPPSRPFPPSLFQTQPHGVLWLMGPPVSEGAPEPPRNSQEGEGAPKPIYNNVFAMGRHFVANRPGAFTRGPTDGSQHTKTHEGNRQGPLHPPTHPPPRPPYHPIAMDCVFMHTNTF